MKQDKTLKLLAFVGLPGSGVSTATRYLENNNVPSVNFGSVVLGKMREAGIEITAENEEKFREQLRAEHGTDAIVSKIIPEIQNLSKAGQRRIVVDGLYSWYEYKALKHEFPGELITVAIVTPKSLRHRRLSIRAERPLTEAQANVRDWAEIENLEKGGPIAMADYYLTNDNSREQFQSHIDELLHTIDF